MPTTDYSTPSGENLEQPGVDGRGARKGRALIIAALCIAIVALIVWAAMVVPGILAAVAR